MIALTLHQMSWTCLYIIWFVGGKPCRCKITKEVAPFETDCLVQRVMALLRGQNYVPYAPPGPTGPHPSESRLCGPGSRSVQASFSGMLAARHSGSPVLRIPALAHGMSWLSDAFWLLCPCSTKATKAQARRPWPSAFPCGFPVVSRC